VEKVKSITMDTLVKRINRVLEKQNECLKVLRGDGLLNELGRYYITDLSANSVVTQDVDPIEIGYELDVLKSFEWVD